MIAVINQADWFIFRNGMSQKMRLNILHLKTFRFYKSSKIELNQLCF
jgi:hypothetical protein